MTFSNPTTPGIGTTNATSPKTISCSGVVGRTYVACLGRYSAADSFDTVTDSGSNTWTRVDYAPKSGTAGRRVELWVCTPTASFSSVTLTFSGTSFATASIVELIGGTGTVNAHNAIERSASTTPAAVTITPSEAKTMVIAFIQANSNTTSQITPSSGWTTLTSASEGPKIVYKYNPTVGTALGVSWTLATGTGSGHAIAAFSETGAAPTSPWTMWNGTQEVTLTLAGQWNGASLIPLTFDSVVGVTNPTPPTAVTTLGWCPPTSTVTDLNYMLTNFRGDTIRLYSSAGSGLQSWTGALFSALPPSSILAYSFKDWPVDISTWLFNRPSNWTTPFYLCLDHEPEQQTGGDPTPAVYKQQWQELINALAGHPRRNEVRLCPIFTEYYARRNSTWESDFGVVCGYSGIDAVGFDIYDSGYSSYRSVTERNDFALSIARKYNKPLIIPEWGIERKSSDTDGTQAAQAMINNINYLRQQPDVPYVQWFYVGGDNLDTRGPEKQAFIDIMANNP